MNIHEYQAKAVLREFGVPVPRGIPAFTVEEAVKAARQLGGPVWVVKAQIHAGGRGKAGGVKVVKSIDDVKQRGAAPARRDAGHPPDRPEGQAGQPALHRGRLGDRQGVLSLGAGRPRHLARRLRGLDRRRHGHRGGGAQDAGEDRHLLGRSGDRRHAASRPPRRAGARPRRRSRQAGATALVAKLYAAFTAKDMSLLEINPLVVTKDGQLICLDAKVGFDDNALYRHPDIVALRDLTEEDAKEIEASKYDLNYVALDGTIGCMVNGAGLAMATMDIIKLYGEAPANFLDVGGGATKEKVAAAFKIITSDPEREGHPGQHLRRHHEVRRHRRGRGGGGEGGRPQGAAGGAARRHQCRARQEDHRRVQASTSPRPTISTTPRRRSSRRCKGSRADVHPDRQEHQGHLPGLHRQERHLPFRSGDRLRHQDGRRHVARQRRLDPSQPAGVRHRGRGDATRPAPTPA